MIRVLLADDQPLVRTGIRLILDAEPDIEVVGEAGDGEDAVRQAGRLRPDVVLMDIQMPIMDGIRATERICAQGGARVLVLTTFHLDEHVVGALRAGASGFLLKDAEAATLTEAIRVVHAGDAIVAPAVTRRLLDRFAHQLDDHPSAGLAAQSGTSRPELLALLTERESQVLGLLSRGLSNAEIAAELVISTATVKTHVHHLLDKLGARDRVQLVVLAHDAGLAGAAGPGSGTASAG
jgi:DNA-binding NarL/FixJ family response regulator